MTDENKEILAKFSKVSGDFKNWIESHSKEYKKLFCDLALAVHNQKMDWYFTQEGNNNYPLRFGRKVPNSKRGKTSGQLALSSPYILVQLNLKPENTTYKNKTDDQSKNESHTLSNEIINIFKDENFKWPKNFGDKPEEGNWPDAYIKNQNQTESLDIETIMQPTELSDEETTMKIGLNTILYGPPGTGKTYSVIDYSHAVTKKDCKESEEIKSEITPDIDSGESEEIKYEITLVTDSKDRESRKSDFDEKIKAGQIRFVTFHQSFSYEEFVEGIRADTRGGNIHYEVKPGIFKQICDDAKAHTEQNYVLIIDEINRGNISKIFGELITLIEPSKRQGGADELVVILPYTQEPFSVPDNLYIIGTMNTADRSLALMDTALRRRFDFVEMPPQPELLKDIEIDEINICTMLTTMNQRIEVLYDREHTLGHAFFMSLNNASSIGDLAEIFQHKIIPLLQEYFFEDWEKIRIVLGDDRKTNEMNQFIIETAINKTIFTSQIIELYNLENSKSYKINQTALNKAGAYLQIYS
ncbi:MAG: AAA family ATPase [Methylococcaceae bacterium]